MAVALQSTDNAAYGSTPASGGEQATNTTAITVDAGTNRALAVLIEGEGDGTAAGAEVSSMTYNGVALTLIARVEATAWSWAEIWGLAAPATGANNLVITLNEADNFNVKVLVATDVDQTTPFRTGVTATGTGTSASVTVASVTADDFVFAILGLDGTGHNPSPGASETEVMERDSTIGGTEGAAYTQPGSAGGVMSPGSVTPWTTSCQFSLAASAFRAVAGGGTPGGTATSSVGITSAATGRRRAQRAATSSVGLTSTATGTGATVRTGSASTQAGFTSQASGRRKSVAHHDEASAVPPFTIPVAGALTVTGAQSAATGVKPTVETHAGAAATTVGVTSVTAGRRKAQRAATTTVGASSTATGRRKAQRAAVSATAATSTAAARRTSRGTASTTIGFTSTGAGNDQPVETHQGAASSTVGLTSNAAGRRVSRGVAASSCGITATATGRRRARGAGASSNGLASTGTARRTSRGACATTTGFASTAGGVNGAAPVRSGAASTLLALTSAVTGRRVARGSCITTFGLASTVTSRNPAGGPLTWGVRPPGRITAPGTGRVTGPSSGRVT